MVGSGTGTGGPGGSPPGRTGGMKGAGSEGGDVGAGGPPPMTKGGMEGVDTEGGNVIDGGSPLVTTGNGKDAGSDGGSVGVLRTSGVGSCGDVLPCGTSDNTLAHRVLIKVVPSVINRSPFATFNLFLVQKISSPFRYET